MILNMSGGGATMNFKVVGGTTAPSNPKENTIWINTATPITSWFFSATEPSSVENGMVWIRTGHDSTSAFNALKKDCIFVYPLYAMQCIGGSMKDVGSQIYQNGKWSVMVSEVAFFADGKFNTATFGAISTACSTSENGIVIYYGNTIKHAKAFDLSAFSTLEIVVSKYNYGNITVDVKNEAGSTVKSMRMTYAKTWTLDIPELTGNHFLSFSCGNKSGDNSTMYSIKFKV